jgi:ATP-dependent protease ClpP protease subunit
MKKRSHVFILGRIGSLLDAETGKIVERGVELVDVIAQARAGGDAEEIEVHINTLGGQVTVSEDIYNYLLSLKATKRIITSAYPDKSKGNRGIIASAGVKIFLAGDERKLRKSADDLFIHYPRMNPGVSDSDRLAAAAEATAKVENKMIADYATLTGNTAEALSPLMKKETALTGTEALALGFATELVDDEVSIEAILNLNKSQMNFKEQITALFDSLKALITAEGGAAPIQYTLASGKVLVTDATDQAKLVGSSATIDGAAAPDGEHPDKDGNTIVVKDGKVAEFKAKAAAAAPPPPPPAPPAATVADLSARIVTMEENQKLMLDLLTKMTTAMKDNKPKVEIPADQIEKLKTEIRAEIKSGHRIPEVGKDQIEALANAWDASMKDNTNAKIKKEDNSKWIQMYYAKYKKYPANP